MKSIQFTIHGIAPMLQHNIRLLDPLNPWAKSLAELTTSSKKSEAGIMEMRWREFVGGLYMDTEEGGYIYVSNQWVESVIRDGATIARKGKAITAGLFVPQDRIPLLEIGTKTWSKLNTAKALFAAGHVDVRPVGLTKKTKVMRARPIFANWGLVFEVQYEESLLNRDNIVEALSKGGMIKGMGDYRPKFGRFEVVSGKEPK